MKEYNITFKMTVESEDSDYEKISDFSEELIEKIMEDNNLIYSDDIEIVGMSVIEIEDDNESDSESDFYEENDN
jgi:hypothetical protein